MRRTEGQFALLISADLQAGPWPHTRQRPGFSEGYAVPSFKDPSFQDRAAAARNAKQKALDKLKAKAPVDEALLAERRQAWEAREQALASERAAREEAKAAAKAESAARKAAELAEAEAAATLKAARLKPASAAEMKAARDARYAARKARK